MPNPLLPDTRPGIDADDDAPSLTHDEVLERSELGRHLRGSIFPADKRAVIGCAEEEHAPPRLLASLRRLPEGEYRNVEGVWEALGGRRDERAADVEADASDASDASAPRAVIPEPPGPAPMPPEPAPVPEPEPPTPEPPTPEPVPTPQIRTFGFRFSLPFRVAARVFLVDPAHARVIVAPGPDGVLTVRYGPWSVETPLENVAGAEVTGPYALVKTIGPPHLSLVDRGLTFASNRDRGVCIRFVEPVRGIDALGVVRHPALTVTVQDVEGLAAALRQG